MLVAISIPIFSAQLEKSREGTDLANLRNAYAECSADVMGKPAGTKVYKEVACQSSGKIEKIDTTGTIGTKAISSIPNVPDEKKLYVYVNSDGKMDITVSSTGVAPFDGATPIS